MEPNPITHPIANPVPEYGAFLFRAREVLRLAKTIDKSTESAAGKISLSGQLSSLYCDRFGRAVLELETEALRLVRSARDIEKQLKNYVREVKQ
jgi:hypothetical protein